MTAIDTPTLADFLLARIAEDEAELGVLQTRDEGAGPNGVGWAEVGAISEVLMISHARAVAECGAKRQVVQYLQYVIAVDQPTNDHLESVLRFLAQPFADHPDYRDEWRP